MQAATAFAQVQVALNWLADNAIRLADWFASSRRVSQLTDAIARLEESLGPLGKGGGIEIGASPDDNVHLRDLDIEQYDGKLMIDGAETTIAPGEKVLVRGDSGTGKSTLIRAMAGLWPWGNGKILKPENAEIAFMPQRPYFPLGTLRQALLYPHPDQKVDEEKIKDALTRVGLEHLMPRLDEAESWSQVLSGGEQQRLAFARVMIHPPDILIMDEPTSSLDELSQFRMMEYMRDFLPDAMVIHVGHRPGLEPFHDREIKLVREQHGGPATTQEAPSSARRIFSRAWQRFGRRRGSQHPPDGDVTSQESLARNE
jgi:putative ATP-binding cassette transporter